MVVNVEAATSKSPARLLRPVLVVVAYLACWLALDALSSAFKVAHDVTVWSPQEGLNFVLLFVFGLRYWPALMLNTPLHAYLVSGSTLSVGEVVIFDATETIIYAAAATLLVRGIKIDRSLGRQRDVVWFVGVACVAAPLLIALVEVPFLTLWAGLAPEHLLRNIVSWWAGDATGIAMMAPFLLVVLSRFARIWDEPPTQEAAKAALPSRGELPEFSAQMVVMVVALLAAYGVKLPGTLEYSYFAFIPLMWIAVSNGFVRTTCALVVANFGAVTLSAMSPVDKVEIPLQFSLLTLTLVGLLIGGMVRERNHLSQRLSYESLHDPLTGLPNRKLFLRRLEAAIRRAGEDPGYGFAVLFIGLNRFNEINTNRGHTFGDRLLAAVSVGLASMLRAGDTLARYGGGEFLVLLDGTGTKQGVARMAEQLLGVFEAPYALAGESAIQVSASIGMVLGDSARKGSEELLRDADLALRRAKTSTRIDRAFFDTELRERTQARFRLEADLRQAIVREELHLEYQLIYPAGSDQPVLAEALARWRHPERGPIPPDDFIPVAEDTGLIVELGHQVLAGACRQMRSWRAAGHKLSKVSVNVSPVQLEYPGFVEHVLETIQASGVEAHRLQLELTEHQRINTPEVDETLRRLAGAGISLSIDDFGTGYSSLDYLGKLPFHGLKIDRSFVQTLPEDAGGRNRTIVEAILALSDKMGLEVTAEGVETVAQRDFLRDQGCELVQGYLFGRPKPARELSLS